MKERQEKREKKLDLEIIKKHMKIFRILFIIPGLVIVTSLICLMIAIFWITNDTNIIIIFMSVSLVAIILILTIILVKEYIYLKHKHNLDPDSDYGEFFDETNPIRRIWMFFVYLFWGF